MTWFKVDDTLAFHRKVVRAGNAAMGLWVRAGAHCSQQLTDGYVPTEIVAVLGTPAQAARLVKAGLWTEVDGGYQFHDWEAINPTRSDVEDRRRADAERKATARAAKNPEKIQQDNRTISPEKSAKNQKTTKKHPLISTTTQVTRDGHSGQSRMCPLYPTRPDPTRYLLT